MNIISQLSRELNIREEQAETVIKLIDEGNTIPFIARYRKEMTGSLNDEVLREFETRLKYLRNLEEKRESIIQTIKEQGKLTDDLEKSILKASTLVELEDLYLPYRPKKRTRATIAKEKGLEPLAKKILDRNFSGDIYDEAKNYVNDEVADEKIAIEGAKDIIAEDISEKAEIRKLVRRECLLTGVIYSKAKKSEEESVYEMYYDYSDKVRDISGHRVLALNRGEKEKFINVSIKIDDEQIKERIFRNYIGDDLNKNTDKIIREALSDSYKRLIYPSVEREIRNQLTEVAENGAIEVFKKNLNQLLMQPPIINKVVLGWDPAFRTGCKLSIVDETGNVLETKVVYPTEPQNKIAETKEYLKYAIDKYGVQLISLGNGTASRESEKIISEFIKENNLNISYVVVSEAGASVYSASKTATEEFPEYGEGQRSSISIARRLQDPLAELVKIDPKSIGIGQYQHDMNQKNLSESLDAVVEDCVNKVGVDLNTASAMLLEKISGITKVVSKNIVEYRNENGKFESRKELLKVKKLGPKMFEQCAGFLRIIDGIEPLDNTAVHPENYDKAYKILELCGYKKEDIGKVSIKFKNTIDEISKKVDIGEITLKDIINEIEKPSRDPREDMPKPIFRSDVLEMKDLKEGMILKGSVRNVIDFGAFVDIGVHEDGLVHISELSNSYVKHPMDVVSVGDIVDVKVLSVDIRKRRIALSMKI